MESNKPKKNKWVKVASKSHPGCYYLFNRSNGQTKWYKNQQIVNNEKGDICETATKNKSKPLKRLQHTPKKVNTPAQDRLKNLQKNLKSQINRSNKTGLTAAASDENSKNLTTNETSKPPANTQEQSNIKKEESSDTTYTSTITPSIQKRKHSDSPASRDSSKSSEPSCNENPAKRFALSNQNKQSDTPSVSASTSTGLTSNTNSRNEVVLNDGNPTFGTSKQNQTDKKSEENGGGFSIFERIKALYNRLKNVNSSAKADDNSDRKKGECSNVSHKSDVLTERLSNTALPNENDIDPAESVVCAVRLMRTRDECKQLPSKVPRVSANARLEAFRKSLLTQRLNDPTDIRATESSTDFVSNDTSEISLDENNCSEEVQPMDCQPIDSGLERTQSNISLLSMLTDETKYQTINDNLSRIMSEKKSQLSNKSEKWLKDHYYFIVDTNIFLLELTFLEDLSKMKFSDTKGSILYIPYSVLQELDHLKGKSWDDNLRSLARRAIRFLNNEFENKSPNFQAQSALEENKHLIDITSGDDSIINCCLQVIEHIPHVLLLTEDINLRNKALSNDITASTRGDLLVKQKSIENKNS